MSTKNTHTIGIDARLSGKQHAGIGRYTENLIKGLLTLNLSKNNQTPVNFVIFFSTYKQAKEVLGDLEKADHLRIVIANIKHYSFQEQFCLPKIYQQAKLDLLYVPHWNAPIFYKGKLAITIHDLLWHEQKGTGATTLKAWQYYLKYVAYRYITKTIAKKAQVIFVPAATIKKTVLRYYPFVKNKIIISKEGLANVYQSALKKQNPPAHRIKKQLIYTGSLYPHKNLKVVIKSLSKIPKYKLLIASSRSIFQDQIQALVSRYKVKKQVSFLGYVTDQKLLTLYQESMALVQPSFSEGFGLTGIEAMAAGLPVLASDIEIFREIYQEAAFLFDPHSCEDFLQALSELELSNRKNIINKGYKIASQYSFEQMAQEIFVELLKQL